jgi:hypothetical protein
MRWLLAIVTGLFVLWSGYWVVGSRAALGAVQTWVRDAPKNGIGLTTGEITLAGYPSRFDLTVPTPEYVDPVTGAAWRAPFVQVMALSYKPWEVIAALPNEQTLSLGPETLAIASDRLRASVKVVPGTALALDNIIVEGDALAVTSDKGWTGSAKHSVIALRQDPSRDTAYEIGVQINELALDPAMAAKLATASSLPAVVDSMTIDALAILTAPLDRNAAQSRPAIDTLDIKRIGIGWGQLAIDAKGILVPDTDGLAKGTVQIEVTNWKELVPLMVGLGVVKPELSQTVENMLGALAQSSPEPTVLKLPLTFKDGWTTLGPLPLGPAPSLRNPAKG